MNRKINDEQMQELLLEAFKIAKYNNDLNNILIYITGLLNKKYYKNQMSLAGFMECSQSSICRRIQNYKDIIEQLKESKKKKDS